MRHKGGKQQTSRIRDILMELDKFAQMLQNPRGYEYRTVGRGSDQSWKHRMSQQKLRKTFTYLKRKNLVREQRRGDRIILTLTNEGKCHIIREQLKVSPSHPKGIVTLVTFDIPENQNTARVFFRRLLKEVGCQQLHRSVWISTCDITGPLEMFIRERELEPWINVIVGRLMFPKK